VWLAIPVHSALADPLGCHSVATGMLRTMYDSRVAACAVPGVVPWSAGTATCRVRAYGVLMADAGSSRCGVGCRGGSP
jgi:hypothetical protein